MTAPAFRLAFAQGMDAATFAAFYLFIGAGTYAEQNPIALAIMGIGGFWLFAALKAGTAIAVALRYDRARRFRTILTLLISVAAASGIVGAAFNTASIISSL